MTVAEDDFAAAQRIAKELKKAPSPFCVWLTGDLGAGKTTTTRAILEAMGLDQNYQVVSPTYTYVNEYQCDGQWVAHLDLYRLNGAVQLADLGIEEGFKDYRGFFVEWPRNVPTDASLAPTHEVVLQLNQDNSRSISFYVTGD